MLSVIRTDIGNMTVVNLIGTIDETTDLDTVIGSVARELHVACKRVSRINSHGIRNWISFFNRVKESGTKITFSECSPYVMEIMNLISNFKCGATIDSVSAPYVCQSCRVEFVAVLKAEDIERLGLGLRSQRCPQCQGTAIFDDDEQTYFKEVTKRARC